MYTKNTLDDIKIEENYKDNYWYITKHDMNVENICYALKVLMEWKKSDKFNEMKYEDYLKMVNEKANKKFNNFRVVSNADYLGLATTSAPKKNYKNKKATKIFYEIYDKCKGDFENTEKYYSLFERQVEKMYLSHIMDEKIERQRFTIHPLFVLYRILLTIKKFTGEARITTQEYKSFVCFIEKYEDSYTCTFNILKSRIAYEIDVREIAKKIDNSRIHLMFGQLDTLNLTKKDISIKETHIDYVLEKVRNYEKYVLSKINKKNMQAALIEDEDIFNFYKGI